MTAYWEQDTDVSALSLVTMDGRGRTVSHIVLSPAWNDLATWLFADNEAAGRKWLANVGYKGRVHGMKALFLPIAQLGDPPFPATNGEMYVRMRDTDPEGLRTLLRFLQKTERPSTILFAAPANDGAAVGAWQHPFYAFTAPRGMKTRRVVGLVPGFREHRHPASLEIAGHNRTGVLVRASVTRVDSERLVSRTSGASTRRPAALVNIVGCGSVGSFIAEALARSGFVSQLRLIDPQCLAVENTLRHVCGMRDVGRTKAEALRDSLQMRFPHVDCEAHATGVLDLLRTQPEALTPSALTVVAIGDLAVEERLNKLLNAVSAPLMAPVCFAWAEPFLIAGHAVLLTGRRPGCLECLFDDDRLFRYRVVADPESFLRREAGCQTSFTPYGGQDTVRFTSAVVRLLLEAPPDNTVLTWIGDRVTAEGMGIRVEHGWRDVPSFSEQRQVLVADPSCPICQ